MAFQSVPETAEVFVEYSQNGVSMGNSFYFRKTGGYTLSDLEDLADDMDSWVATEWLPLLSQDVSYARCVVRGLENEEDYVTENNDGVGAGGIAVAGLPNNVTFAFKRLSGFTGRSARGRVYMTGIGTSFLTADENIMNGTKLLNLLAVLAEIVNYVITHGWVEVIVSRYHEGMKRTTAQTLAVSEWSYSNSKVDTQRRRLS
jgi:hypothetical protein